MVSDISCLVVVSPITDSSLRSTTVSSFLTTNLKNLYQKNDQIMNTYCNFIGMSPDATSFFTASERLGSLSLLFAVPNIVCINTQSTKQNTIVSYIFLILRPPNTVIRHFDCSNLSQSYF